MLAGMDDLYAFRPDDEVLITREDGTELRCFGAGVGPTVVLAHGYLDEHHAFDEIAARLVASGRRVVLFDQRAHGRSTAGADGVSSRSMAEDYEAVLRRFDVEDAVLVGHSMGAFLSVVFSILHADVARRRLRGLVLVGGHAGEVAKGSPQNLVQITLIESGVMRLVTATTPTARAMARTLFGEVAEPRFVARAADTLRRADQKATLPILKAQVSESYYAQLDEVPVPAIVVCGELDKTCPRWHSERLGAEIRGSRNVWLPRVGHMVNFEAPAAILEAVEEHMRREAPRVREGARAS
jgi:pimeloyl-ACP methyl ester carboxylesterase